MPNANEIVQPPQDVILHRKSGTLELHWPDGLVSRHSYLALRQACACSGCTQARRRGLTPPIDPQVSIREVRPMGVSGLQFIFSDGHERGIYPWRYLRELSETTS